MARKEIQVQHAAIVLLLTLEKRNRAQLSEPFNKKKVSFKEGFQNIPFSFVFVMQLRCFQMLFLLENPVIKTANVTFSNFI